MEWMYEEWERLDGQMEKEEFSEYVAAYRLPEEFLALEQEEGLKAETKTRIKQIRKIFGGEPAPPAEAAPAASGS